jgi:hypothetical protein
MGFNSGLKGLMYELKKNGKVFTSKFVGTGPSSYEKRVYRAAITQRLRNTGVDDAQLVTALPKHAAKQQKLQGVRRRLLQICDSEQDVRHSSWKEQEVKEEGKLAGEEERSKMGKEDAGRGGSNALL